MRIRLSLKQRFLLISSILLLGCAFLGALIIYPTMNNMFTISTDIRSIQQELEAEYTETQAMRRTLREVESVTEEIPRYAAMVFSAEHELSAIEEMESLAAEKNLNQTLNATLVSTPDARVGLSYYLFSFSVSGTFDDIFSYIQTLESRPYYILIEGMRLQKISEGQASLRFDARMYTTPADTSFSS